MIRCEEIDEILRKNKVFCLSEVSCIHFSFVVTVEIGLNGRQRRQSQCQHFQELLAEHGQSIVRGQTLIRLLKSMILS